MSLEARLLYQATMSVTTVFAADLRESRSVYQRSAKEATWTEWDGRGLECGTPTWIVGIDIDGESTLDGKGAAQEGGQPLGGDHEETAKERETIMALGD